MMRRSVIAVSRVTTQNQTSVPAEVRRLFKVGPGTELAWVEQDGRLEVMPKGNTLEDVRALLRQAPRPASTLGRLRSMKVQAVLAKHRRGQR
jgi:bifunctional DNA-binding transcriptional regulator/antitoxin component of YhaV-PrlF toxin-antitoxin module